MSFTKKTNRLVVLAAGALLAFAIAGPAHADRHWHGRPHDDHRWHRGGYYTGGYYAPPPVVYAPEPVYAAPPVVYGDEPGVNLNFNLR